MPSLATLPKSGLAASTRALLNAARNRTMLAGHSVAPASLAAMARQASTQGKPSVVAVRDALNEGLAEEMAADKDVFVMGEEVGQFQGAYKVTRGLLDRFGPNRVVDTPISEMGFTGLCSGAAMAGLKPVCEFMTWNFAMQSIDHILNSSAKTYYMSGGQKHSNIVFRGPNGAAAGVAAQHSQDYTSWYSQCPGLIVMAPYSAEDAKGMIKAAIREPNPVVLLENELGYADTFEVSEEYHSDNFVTPIGKAKIERPGKDVSIVSHSRNLKFCLEAAETLAKEGIDAEVINLRTLRPLDLPAVVESVKKTGRIVTVEAGFPSYGLGSEIAGLLGETDAWDYLDAPVMRCTGADVPTPYSEELEALCFPDGPTIVKAVKEVCYV